MKCSSTCQYLIREEDTSGGFMGLEADRTNYSCGYNWPKTQHLCSVGFGKDLTAECIQGLNQIPEGPKRVTFGMLEAKKLDDEFMARELEAGLTVPL